MTSRDVTLGHEPSREDDDLSPDDRWGNERYVRLLTRETADRAAWCWQARALMPWLLVKADGAGLIETSKGARGLAAITMLPLDVVTPGLEELVADGFVVAVDGGYLVRNYVAVQNATMSANQRQARHRDRKRSEAALASRGVTSGHAVSREGHAKSLLADPILAEPKEELSPARSGDTGSPAAAEPQPAPTPAPVIRDRHQQVLTGAWAYHRERFLALQGDGIGKNAIPPNALAMGSAEVELAKRINELREKGVGYDDIAAKLRHRVDVGEAESRRESHVNWFGSTNTWSFGPFWRALESSVEQAREPKPTAPARASPRGRGTPPAPPATNHRVSTSLEGFD